MQILYDEILNGYFILDNEDDDEGHGYLHPSLMVTRKASPAPEVPAYKPLEMPKVSVHDTPYGQLIKSLVKKQQPDATEEWVKSSFSNVNEGSF